MCLLAPTGALIVIVVYYTVLGKLGPGKLGPGQLGPGQLGPTVRGPICHFLEVDSWAPDNWAPGPNCPGPNLPLFQGGQLGPEQSGPGKVLLFFHDVWFFCNSRWFLNVWGGVYWILDGAIGILDCLFCIWDGSSGIVDSKFYIFADILLLGVGI